MSFKCIKCIAWNIAAKENGYASGMCEECFNKYFVHVELPYQPERSKREDMDGPNHLPDKGWTDKNAGFP